MKCPVYISVLLRGRGIDLEGFQAPKGDWGRERRGKNQFLSKISFCEKLSRTFREIFLPIRIMGLPI
jgi:hypothetical protein